MNPHLIILLILIPMLTGIVSLLMAGRRRMRRVIGGIGTQATLAMSIVVAANVCGEDGTLLVSQMGDWAAPFGITLVVDPLSALMSVTAALVVAVAYPYCVEQLSSSHRGEFFDPIFHLLAAGVQWSFITGDLFNLFVAFEIMLMASYALLVSGTSKAQMTHAYKYMLLNLLASTLFVTCCGLIYGQLGTLNLASLAQITQSAQLPPSAVPVVAVLLVVFGAKSAIFPLWFWLPDTYHTMPAALGGLFAGLFTKVGAYVLLRLLVMVFGLPDGAAAETLRPVILTTAGVTMFVGVLGAVSMTSIRRILSVHIISQVGYMVLAVGLGMSTLLDVEHRQLAVAAGIYFILHNMVVKTALFLCGGLMCHVNGTDELDRMGGIARQRPWLAVLFFIAALSLVGLPPLSGFFGKVALVIQSFRGTYYALAVAAIATSVLTMLSMLKIWCSACWGRPPALTTVPATPTPGTRPASVRLAMTSTAILVMTAVSMGVFAEQYMTLARRAGATLVDPSLYINAVLPPPAPSAVLMDALVEAEEQP